MIFAQSNAKQYANAIEKYANETGKTFAEALAREGPDFRNELFNQFSAIRPKENLFDVAKQRNYRVARQQSTFLVHSEGGLSQRAIDRAKAILGDQKSDMFRWIGSRLVPVRFSSRKGHGVLQGGRSGTRFKDSALRAYQLSPEQLERVSQSQKYKTYGVRRLNLRALAVYLELRYRQRAASGGTMAMQWLFKTWRKGNSHERARLIQRSNTGVPVGTIDFVFDVSGNLSTIVFTGNVPGTGTEASKHGILDKVFAVRAPALLKAIQMHHAKVASRFH